MQYFPSYFGTQLTRLSLFFFLLFPLHIPPCGSYRLQLQERAKEGANAIVTGGSRAGGPDRSMGTAGRGGIARLKAATIQSTGFVSRGT